MTTKKALQKKHYKKSTTNKELQKKHYKKSTNYDINCAINITPTKKKNETKRSYDLYIL
jgi:hypothetical protein